MRDENLNDGQVVAAGGGVWPVGPWLWPGGGKPAHRLAPRRALRGLYAREELVVAAVRREQGRRLVGPSTARTRPTSLVRPLVRPVVPRSTPRG